MTDYKSDDWQFGEAELGGMLAIVRRNVSLRNVTKSAYPHRLLVSLVMEDIQEDGQPGSEEERQLLDTTEESIADHFTENFGALFAMTVTSDGVRDLFLFLPQAPEESELDAAFEACEPVVDYDFDLGSDPDWSVYQNTLPFESN